jgi:hypothetical protein
MLVQSRGVNTRRRDFLGILGGAMVGWPVSAHAADTVTIGLVGSTGPTHWPIHIGLKKGYYVAEGIKLDLIFIQSSGAVLQQLAAARSTQRCLPPSLIRFTPSTRARQSRSSGWKCSFRPMR